jgi:hypothetical protein
MAAIAAWAAPALGQGGQQIVAGSVVQITGNRITVGANAGPVTVQTGPATRYEKEGPGTLADLRPDQLVGVTGQPSTGGQLFAVQIRVFPAAINPTPGQRAMGGANMGNLMTNATIVDVADDELRISAAGSTYAIRTSPETEVRMPVPATAGDVQEGGRIAATGSMDGDGVLQATTINILGPPPEMLPAGPGR